MYTDDELNGIRFQISRAFEAVNRQIERYMEREPLWDLYVEIDRQRSRLSEIVRDLTRDSVFYDGYVKGYNSADEAALAITLASSASDDDRPNFLDTTKDHLYRTVEYLAMS